MPARLQPDLILEFLKRIGERYTRPARLYLFGGAAVVWLGNPRPTVDLDLHAVGADDALRAVLTQAAAELDIDLELAVPADFVPPPPGAESRHTRLGTFGDVEVFVLDPYSQAIMKIARGFETDMEDAAFLVTSGHVQLQQLEEYIAQVAGRHDEPLTLRRNFQEFKRNLSPRR